MRKLKTVDSLIKGLLKDPETKDEYDKLEPEFQLMWAIIDARSKKNINQKELAKLVKTSQGKISMIEAGLSNPTIQTMNKIAQVLGKKLQIKFV